MTWWEAALVFVGVPAALFAIITALVMALANGRVPDGLAAAADAAATDGGRDDVEDSNDRPDEAPRAPNRRESGPEQSAD